MSSVGVRGAVQPGGRSATESCRTPSSSFFAQRPQSSICVVMDLTSIRRNDSGITLTGCCRGGRTESQRRTRSTRHSESFKLADDHALHTHAQRHKVAAASTWLLKQSPLKTSPTAAESLGEARGPCPAGPILTSRTRMASSTSLSMRSAAETCDIRTRRGGQGLSRLHAKNEDAGLRGSFQPPHHGGLTARQCSANL